MNMASWIILGIVIVIVGLAAWGTFGKMRRGGGCCGGESKTGVACNRAESTHPSEASAECMGCQGCSDCSGCSSAHILQPIIKPIE